MNRFDARQIFVHRDGTANTVATDGNDGQSPENQAVAILARGLLFCEMRCC
jgi:hypothetical protein